MKVVLLDDLVNVGEAGQVVDVKDGYARNYLIPQGMAERATKDSLNRVEIIKRAAEVKRARRMDEAAAKYSLIKDKVLTIRMKAGTESRLFGAVTSAMIADEVQRQFNIDLDRRHVMLEEPIKHLGEFTVPLRASAEVTGELKVTVQPEIKVKEIEQEIIERARAEEAAREVAESETADTDAPPQVEEAEQAAEAQEKYEEHEAELTEPE